MNTCTGMIVSVNKMQSFGEGGVMGGITTGRGAKGVSNL